MRSLLQRHAAFEQKKARLADVENRLRLAEKRDHTRRIYAVAALLEKTALLDEELPVIYGAFLHIREELDSTQARAQWGTAGAQAIENDRQESPSDHEAVILTFAVAPVRELGVTLRAAGFRFNKILQHWEGVACFKEAEQIASSHQGVASRYAEVAKVSPHDS